MKTRILCLSSGVVASLVLVTSIFAGNEKTAVYPAGSLIGMDVINSKRETLGEIEDFVVNIKTGRIVYAAMRHGTTLGFGGKLFAIPPAGLFLTQDGKNFLLEHASADFDAAKGFDANTWPSVPEARWGKTGDIKDGEAMRDKLYRVSKIQGLHVRNMQGEDLGKAYDLAVNWYSPRVVYIAVSHGGTLGVGSKLTAVPFDDFTFQSTKLNPARRELILRVSKANFDRASTFQNDNWPPKASPGFTPLAK